MLQIQPVGGLGHELIPESPSLLSGFFVWYVELDLKPVDLAFQKLLDSDTVEAVQANGKPIPRIAYIPMRMNQWSLQDGKGSVLLTCHQMAGLSPQVIVPFQGLCWPLRLAS